MVRRNASLRSTARSSSEERLELRFRFESFADALRVVREGIRAEIFRSAEDPTGRTLVALWRPALAPIAASRRAR